MYVFFLIFVLILLLSFRWGVHLVLNFVLTVRVYVLLLIFVLILLFLLLLSFPFARVYVLLLIFVLILFLLSFRQGAILVLNLCLNLLPPPPLLSPEIETDSEIHRRGETKTNTEAKTANQAGRQKDR